MDISRIATSIFAVLCLTSLSACQLTDNAYYVKPDSSPAVVAGVAELAELPKETPALQLGVTFKSNGVVSAVASDALYKSFCDGIRVKGNWKVERIGHAGDDFAPQIAAVKPVPVDMKDTKDVSGKKSKPAPAMKTPPRMLVLIEDRADLSSATRASYFFSGMTYGAAQVHKPTDRYDVTIAYRDVDGVERIYRSHHDLVFATGSQIFGRDPSPGPGYKRFESSQSAFNGIVDNSVNGTRRGKVTVGPAVAANAQKPAAASAPVPGPAPASSKSVAAPQGAIVPAKASAPAKAPVKQQISMATD